ncbi:hypothetical protein VA599_10280 [Chromobacterium sp. TRC.1.1.SA]|uniref:Uncharacterized protein n=1 Tax=Chromobacterium indicum TaxID=3110228 RepID=A0ABV0CL39_9NEIS
MGGRSPFGAEDFGVMDGHAAKKYETYRFLFLVSMPLAFRVNGKFRELIISAEHELFS